MKRILCYAISTILLMTFGSCNFKEKTNKQISSSQVLSNSLSKSSSSENKTTSANESSQKSPSKSTSSLSSSQKSVISKGPNVISNPILINHNSSSTSSNSSSSFTSSNSSATSNSSTSNNYEVEDDDISKYMHIIAGTVVNWVCENDTVYSITKSPNRFYIFNALNMQTILDVQLPAIPAEINLVNDQILISFPLLKSIKYYSKSSKQFLKEMILPNIVSSFCIDNDFVYYSEDDQHCKVYRTQISTGNTVVINKLNQSFSMFYFPKLLLNKADRILYIADSNTTGGKIYYFDMDTLIEKSCYQGNGLYGYSNITRFIAFDEDYVYFGKFKLDKLDATKIIGEYTPVDYELGDVDGYWTGITFVNDNFVITTTGIYDKDSFEPILPFPQRFSYSLITSSENLLLYNSQIKTFYNFPNV